MLELPDAEAQRLLEQGCVAFVPPCDREFPQQMDRRMRRRMTREVHDERA